MDIDQQMLRGNIDLIILASLYQRDLYGYELAKSALERTEGLFEIKEGTLYLALKRLEQAGCVESYWGEGDVGARRKYYRILPAGKNQIHALKKQWQTLSHIINLFLTEVTDS